MSLELALQENVATMKLLIAALTASSPIRLLESTTVAVGDTSKTVTKVVAEEKPKAVAVKKPEPKTEAAKPANVAKPVVGPDSSEKEAGPTLEEVSKLVLQIAKEKGRPAIIELLGKFGAAKAPELKAADYEAFVAAANEVLAAEESLV